MTGFSTEWLTLREPFDAGARAQASTVVAFACGAGGAAPREVLDLACGTGSNLRALVTQLGPGQRWRAVDHDRALLQALPASLRAWAAPLGVAVHAGRDGIITLAGNGFDARVQLQQLDLARDLDLLLLPAEGLVTASALLDLVSADWLDALLHRAAQAQSTVLFALSVDGRIDWAPADADDARVQSAFDAHQRRDKGFGPALGPRAVPALLARLSTNRWATCSARADWQIDGATSPRMLQSLIDGTAAAAAEQAPGDRAVVNAWRQRRSARLGETRLMVGHVDVAARPLP